MALNLGTMYTTLEARVASFVRDMDSAGKSVMKYGESARRAGRFTTRYISAPFIAAGGLSFKWSKDFQSAFELTNTMLKLGYEDSQRFKEGVLDLSDTYGKAAADIASASYKVTSVLQTGGAATLKIVEQVTRGAVAGKITVVKAGEAIINVMSVYSLGAKHAAYVTDVVARAVRLGNATWRDAAVQMPRVAGLAKPLGVRLMELGGAFAYMSGKGGTSRQSATMLLNLFAAMINPTDRMRLAIRDIGKQWGMTNVQSAKALIQNKGLAAVMRSLSRYVGEDTNLLVEMIPGLRGIAGSTAAFSNQAREFSWVMRRMGGYIGETSRQMEAQNRWAFKLELAYHRVQNAGIRAFRVIQPGVSMLADKIGRLAVSFSNMTKPFQTLIVWTGVFLAAAGPATFILGAWIKALGAVYTVIAPVSLFILKMARSVLFFTTTIKVAVGGLMSFIGWLTGAALPVALPIVAATAAVLLFGRAIVDIYGEGETFSKRLFSAWNKFTAWLKGVAASTVSLSGKVVGFFWNIRHNISTVFKWIKSNWQELVAGFVRVIPIFWQNMAKNIGTFAVKMTELAVVFGKWAKDFGTTFVYNMVEGMITGVGVVGEFIGDFFSAIKTGIVQGWSAVKWSDWAATMKEDFMKVWEGTSTGNLFADIMNIDWAKGWVNPYEGFKWNLPKLEGLDLDSPLGRLINGVNKVIDKWKEWKRHITDTSRKRAQLAKIDQEAWRGSEAALRRSVAAERIIANYFANMRQRRSAEVAQRQNLLKEWQQELAARNAVLRQRAAVKREAAEAPLKVAEAAVSKSADFVKGAGKQVASAVSGFGGGLVGTVTDVFSEISDAFKKAVGEVEADLAIAKDQAFGPPKGKPVLRETRDVGGVFAPPTRPEGFVDIDTVNRWAETMSAAGKTMGDKLVSSLFNSITSEMSFAHTLPSFSMENYLLPKAQSPVTTAPASVDSILTELDTVADEVRRSREAGRADAGMMDRLITAINSVKGAVDSLARKIGVDE